MKLHMWSRFENKSLVLALKLRNCFIWVGEADTPLCPALSLFHQCMCVEHVEYGRGSSSAVCPVSPRTFTTLSGAHHIVVVNTD